MLKRVLDAKAKREQPAETERRGPDLEEHGRIDISAVELAYMDVWPAQTVRTDMIEVSSRRIEQQGSRR